MHTKFRFNRTITSKVMTIVCLLCGVVHFCCCSCGVCKKNLQRNSEHQDSKVTYVHKTRDVFGTQNSTTTCPVTKISYLLLQHSIFTFTTKHENVTIDIYFYNKNLRDSTVYFYNKLERIIGSIIIFIFSSYLLQTLEIYEPISTLPPTLIHHITFNAYNALHKNTITNPYIDDFHIN